MLCCCGSSFFFLPLFFCSSLVKDYSLATCFSPAPLSFSLSLARLYCCEPVFFFFPCALYPRDVETVICTYAHSRIYCPIIHFFFHGSELNCFCIYSFLHALTFFFFETRTHGFANLLFFSLSSSFPSHNFIGNLLTPFFVCWFHPLLARSSTHLYTFPFPLLLS